jgi:hypothetical protein
MQHAEIVLMRVLKIYVLAILLLPLSGNGETSTPPLIFKERSISGAGGAKKQIDVFRGKTLLKTLACHETDEWQKKCYMVALSAGGFVMVDCYTHDSVLETCEISKYKENADEDKDFKTPFDKSFKNKNQIDSIEKLEESKTEKNYILVTGHFQYEPLDGLPDRKRGFCIGDDCVGFGGYSTKATLSFDPKGKIISHKVITKAVFPYTDIQVKRELKKQISELENNIKKTDRSDAIPYFKAQLEEYKRWLKELPN